jgi:N-acetylneuraminic acid mutarotase
MNDLWKFSLHEMKWEKLKPKGFLPSTRYVHASAMMDSHMVVFGGEHFLKDQSVKKDHKLNDVWVYSIRDNRWTQLSDKNCDVRACVSCCESRLPRPPRVGDRGKQ